MTAEGHEDHARAGVEHLQAAAREMIRATRRLLDAAEELVDDPAAIQGALSTFATFAQAAAGRLRGEDGTAPEDGRDDDGHVQRIRVS
ncbi:MAG: hypothetical protein ACT4OV_15905 [Microthrixaceae bacterium]